MPEYPALLNAAPQHARTAVEQTLHPQRAALSASVKARPRNAKKSTVVTLVDLIGHTSDPQLLAAIALSGDRRVKVADARTRHPGWPVARRLVLLETASQQAALQDLEENEVTAQTFTADTLLRVEPAALTGWVLTRDTADRAAWHAAVVTALAGHPDAGTWRLRQIVDGIALIVLDVALTDDGETLLEQLPAELVNRALRSALSSIGTIDARVAQLLVARRLDLPSSRHDFPYAVTDDAVPILLTGHMSLVTTLMTTGALQLTDDDALTLGSRLEPSDRARVLQASPYRRDVAEALLPGLAHTRSNPTNADVFYLMDTCEDLSTEARMTVASHGGVIELLDWLSGKLLNTPRPGEARMLVEMVHRQDAVTSWNLLVRRLAAAPAERRQPGLIEAAETVVDLHAGTLDTLLAGKGLLACVAADRVRAALGDDAAAWTMALGLTRQWEGTLDELLETATLL